MVRFLKKNKEVFAQYGFRGFVKKAYAYVLFHSKALYLIYQQKRKLRAWKKHQNNLTLDLSKESSRSPKIVYIIPSTNISGGIAVILQHVNLLFSKGYDVAVLNQGPRRALSWFPNQKVPIIENDPRNACQLRNVDMLIATGWETVPFLNVLPAKRHVYFVQSDERRFTNNPRTRTRIHKTYLQSCEYMTEAKWIQRWLKVEFGHDAAYVPNGLDPLLFFPAEPLHPKNKRPRVLIEGPIDVEFKGMDDAYAAIKDLDCDIWIVSSSGRPRPEWRYEYFFEKVPIHEMKSMYSSCDIFLKMSRVEGFFGPPMEAMACGVAVVVAKVTGYDEYICDGKNALVVEPRDVAGARTAVNTLIHDPLLRNRLVKNGYETAHAWSWETSLSNLEEFIQMTPRHETTY